MKIAVLAVQGAFIEHEQMLSRLGVDTIELRQRSDLEKHFDGLIIPGGESTVQGKLLRELGMLDELKARIENALPVFGTCAGLILLAKKIKNDERVHFGTMDIVALRNAYGRQLGSFYDENEFEGIGKIPMTFIRAPYIESVSGNVEVLARSGGNIVAARQKNQLVTSFHPELNDDLSVHKYFIDMIKNSK
ncbi:MAG: pyridoxal 5'-phosphate synthase glutaminase subunit PdxT [Clostridia bacterium]|nr:pyridoxal 5'-phosphate synthase glutaminase subunit PdxT [Clostridia bacterium]